MSVVPKRWRHRGPKRASQASENGTEGKRLGRVRPVVRAIDRPFDVTKKSARHSRGVAEKMQGVVDETRTWRARGHSGGRVARRFGCHELSLRVQSGQDSARWAN